MNFTPLYDRILVRPEEAPTETASGLIKAEQSDKRTIVGIIISMGKGRPMEHLDNLTGDVAYYPMHFKVGDRVYFGKYSASEIVLDSVKYYLVKEGEIYGHEEEA